MFWRTTGTWSAVTCSPSLGYAAAAVNRLEVLVTRPVRNFQAVAPLE
jgi:hypothetical protein